MELKINPYVDKNEMLPDDDQYEYRTSIVRIDMDKEMNNDFLYGKGFEISEPQGTKKDNKSENSIYSSKFGTTIMDLVPYIEKYSCVCGHIKGAIYKGHTCPLCKSKVKYVGDNFDIWGWMRLTSGHIIHPSLFLLIQSFVGAENLDNILCIRDEKDINGFSKKRKDKLDSNPYSGIGIIEFEEKFDEIMKYYLSKYPAKKEKYDAIYEYNDYAGKSNRDLVFISGIPVFTTHLRPYRIDNGVFAFEGCNKYYNIMAKLVHVVNKDTLGINRKSKPKNQLLYDIQTNYNKLSLEIQKILAQKKGVIRTSVGGRCNFTSRSVIVPGPELRCDCVRLPYRGLVQLLEQVIVNILKKTYAMSYHDAYKKWSRATRVKDETIYNIIQNIIHEHEVGIPVLINRNPTINFGSIMQMYCIGINDNDTMSIPLQVLPFLAADFDGDTLNIMFLINKEMIAACEKTFNPRNTMYISTNDGRFDNRLNHAKDTIVNCNTLRRLGIDSYTQEELNQIKYLKGVQPIS
jgi:DNA-directed RNA polymerase beta' subunit